ncbi:MULTISPECIES: SDR family oxidoreductase [unclassified Streptomyces]|uniref:SDR family oxidoreductase n=1 Tax=unclassified Streptomyces TaxID=2593676 RepID=UPI002DDC3B2A|nr:SDR family oxidoreductase [Streptomyces sp. NBC_01750]WSB04899.1 SDR family oxidoreductase [Streptomyces sp. NBC_01794]WSD30823.1 SDR family oxidoreductase [Streptomyces sp. NBC_01750]
MADGGAIVNTTSNSALESALESGLEPGCSAYASMKGGLIVLTRYMAKEFSKRAIRVNAVAPGSTRTRISENAFERFPEVIPALAAKTALGRVGEPDDIGW